MSAAAELRYLASPSIFHVPISEMPPSNCRSNLEKSRLTRLKPSFWHAESSELPRLDRSVRWTAHHAACCPTLRTFIYTRVYSHPANISAGFQADQPCGRNASYREGVSTGRRRASSALKSPDCGPQPKLNKREWAANSVTHTRTHGQRSIKR